MTLISEKNFGHWESDSVESSDRKCALNMLLERVSRVCHITKLPSKKALATSNAICKKLSIYPPSPCLSITYDNGSENTEFKKVEEQLNNRPRKCLGFKTPNEVYNELGGALPIRI